MLIGDGTPDSPWLIHDLEDFKKIGTNEYKSGHFMQVSNIDFSAAESDFTISTSSNVIYDANGWAWENFDGTDFTVGDMEVRNLNINNFKIMRESPVNWIFNGKLRNINITNMSLKNKTLGGRYVVNGINIENMTVTMTSYPLHYILGRESFDNEIRNVNIDGLRVHTTGNFGICSGNVIDKVDVDDCIITAGGYVGVVTYNRGGSIKRCRVNAIVEVGSSEIIGGIAAFASNAYADIEACYVNLSAAGGTVGGIVANSAKGNILNSTVRDCEVVGLLDANYNAGGIIASHGSDSGVATTTIIERCICKAIIKSVDRAGGIVDRGGTVINCFALSPYIVRKYGRSENFGRIVGVSDIGSITNSYALESMEFYTSYTD